MATSDEAAATADRHIHDEDTAPDWLTGGGTTGNERLTAAVGAALIVLLAVLRIRGLLSVHLFVGMLLSGPVMSKLSSTGYRFDGPSVRRTWFPIHPR